MSNLQIITENSEMGAISGTRHMPVWLYDPFCFTPWYTAELAVALKQLGGDVRLLCGTFRREPDYFTSRSLNPEIGLSAFSRIQSTGPGYAIRLLRFTQALATVRMLIDNLRNKDRRPKALHLQQLPMLDHGLTRDFALISEAQRFNVPVVHTVHNVLPHKNGEAQRAIYAELYEKVDHLICHSNYAAQRLVREFYISESKISVIPHGPLFSATSPCQKCGKTFAKQKLALPPGATVFLWQGILSEYKGLDLLLEAWELYVAPISQTINARPLLLIAGTGPAEIESTVRNSAKRMASSVRADLRYIDSEELPYFYDAADVLLYPYRAITTSGALLTGLSYRKPIIASNLTPFGDYLREGDNALLFEPADVKMLGQVLQKILVDYPSDQYSTTNAPPQTLLHRLSLGALSNRSRYVGWNSIAAQTMELYERLSYRSR